MDAIQHIVYINLDSRTDRRVQMEQELKKANLNDRTIRFSAVNMPNLGAIGCSMSHLKCLQMAKENKWSHVLILEDDIEFTDIALLNRQLSTFFTHHPMNNDCETGTRNESRETWDVCMLAGNCYQPYEIMEDQGCVKVKRCLTTAAYLVNGHYYDILIQNIREGVSQLINAKQATKKYAIDVYWLSLQESHRWYLINPITITQRAGYSDIENVCTDFSQHLLELH